MKNVWLIIIALTLLSLLFSGCTSQTQDDEFKSLLSDTITQFSVQNEKILQPYSGMTITDLTAMRSFAEKAKSIAQQMKLSDTGEKARDIYLQALDSTITGTNLLINNADSTSGKIDTTSPATTNFINSQYNLNTVADIMKLPK